MTDEWLDQQWEKLADMPVGWKKQKPGESTKKLSYTYIRNTFYWLRTAVANYLSNRNILWTPPFVVPSRGVKREEFLTRDDLARMLWACRGRIWLHEMGTWLKQKVLVDGKWIERNYIDHKLKQQAKGLAKALLLMAYTGMRKEACKKILWQVHATRGHIDVVEGVLRRVGFKQANTKKTRHPTSLMLDRIVQHCRRWQAADRKRGYVYVVRNKMGAPYTSSFDVIFDSVVDAAGLPKVVVPHTLRHTCATWQAIVGVPIQAAADLLGMTVDTLEEVYRKWCPASQEAARDCWRNPVNLARLKRVKFADLPDRDAPDGRLPMRQLPRDGRKRTVRQELRQRAWASGGVL